MNRAYLGAVLLLSSPGALAAAAPFLRGDANADGSLDLSDAVATLTHLFLGGGAPPCPDAADANDDGKLDIADPVTVLQYLFLGGDPVPEPRGHPGEDPTPDALGCGLGLAFEELEMRCLDLVTRGGTLEAVVGTQEEYEQLIHERFQKPLDAYWNEHYPSVKAEVERRNPGISPAECERKVKEVFYSFPPFEGTEECTHPEIDFSELTLLGQDANASGCSPPEVTVEVVEDEREKSVTFRLRIREHGLCEAYFSRNVWVLVPRIKPGFTIRFEKERLRGD